MRWISEKDQGMYDAIKKGFEMAKGDIFCWLNSDDMYMPWALQTVSSVMINPKIQWCTGIPSQFNEFGINYCQCRIIPTYSQKVIKKGLMEGRRLGCIQQESTFWTKELYVKSGGINPDYLFAGDYYLWKSFAGYEKLYVVNSILAGFRVHKGQKSEDRSKYYGEIGMLHTYEKLSSKVKLYSLRRFLHNYFTQKSIIRINNINF
jgi:hypothetical protein